MSIRIHHGFRLADRTLEAAFELLHAFRPRVATLRRAHSGTLLARAAVTMLDRAATRSLAPAAEPEAAAMRPLGIALHHLLDRTRTIDREGLRDPEVDHGFEIVLFPHHGDILGIAFTERESWRAAWMEHAGAEAFGYWDNTDPPEHVSDDAWDARETAWATVLGRDPGWRPSHAGLTTTLSEAGPDILSAAEVLAYVPDLESRVVTRARDLLNGRRLAEALPESPLGTPDTWRLMRALHDASEHFETEAGRAELAELAGEIRPLLPHIDAAALIGA